MNRHTPPLIVGTPVPPIGHRPRCPNCNKRLLPLFKTNSERVATAGGGFTYKNVSKEWLKRYDSYGNFCTLRCCEKFANAAFRDGYRIEQ